MSLKVGAPQDVRKFQNQERGKQLAFDAKWSVTQAPPNTEIGIKAVGKILIVGKTAEIQIYQILGGVKNYIDLITAIFENGEVNARWRTTSASGANMKAGVYHFRVSVGGFYGETVQGLVLRDSTVDIYRSSFETANPSKKKIDLGG